MFSSDEILPTETLKLVFEELSTSVNIITVPARIRLFPLFHSIKPSFPVSENEFVSSFHS